MYGNIIVERIEDDKMGGQIWYFSYLDSGRLKLTQYINQRRETMRHKFKPVKTWNMYDMRSIPSTIALTIEDVPLPEDVKADAIKSFMSRIQCGKPTDFPKD